MLYIKSKNTPQSLVNKLHHLAKELGKYQVVGIVYDNEVNMVSINEGDIQIFSDVMHINPSTKTYLVTEDALKMIKAIQKEM